MDKWNSASFSQFNNTDEIATSNNVKLGNMESLRNKDKYDNSDSQSTEEYSTLNGYKQNFKETPQDVQSEPFSLFDNILSLIASEVKSHLGFLSKNENGKVCCNICKFVIEPMTNITQHLKTKLHEVNALKFINNFLPTELHHIMEFVSFKNSNLCCNLCSSTIYFCSNNPNETIMNIMAHNLTKEHVEKKVISESIFHEALNSLKSLPLLNPVISDNHQFLDVKMQPQFICKLCNSVLGCHLNEKSLYETCNAHFTSKTHLKYKVVVELESFKSLDISADSKHNFTVKESSVYCTVCKCFIEPNVHELTSHVKRLSPNEGSHSFLSNESEGYQNNLVSTKKNSSTAQFLKESINPTTLTKNVEKKSEKLQMLLQSLSQPINDSKYVIESEGKIMCLICNCELPQSPHNIETHLLGKVHISNRTKRPPMSRIKSEISVKTTNILEEAPAPPQKELEFIKTISNKLVYCLMCNVNISNHGNCIQEHIDGIYHKKSLKKHNKNVSLPNTNILLKKPSKSDEAKSNKAVSTHNTGNALETLCKSNEAIKNFTLHLREKDDHYICTLRESKIIKSGCEKTLKNNILGHVESKIHKKHTDKVCIKLLEKILKSNVVVESNKQFLSNQDGKLCCTLCSCDIPVTVEETSFKRNILSHLTGSTHNVSLNEVRWGKCTTEFANPNVLSKEL